MGFKRKCNEIVGVLIFKGFLKDCLLQWSCIRLVLPLGISCLF